MSHAGTQLEVEFFWQYTTTAGIFLYLIEVPDPIRKKSINPRLNPLYFKRGPTTFALFLDLDGYRG